MAPKKSRNSSAGKPPRTAPKPPVPSDVLGSYTGRPADGGAPVQDADDL